MSDALADHILQFADQITTLATKLHHKELDLDEANTLSVGYQERFKAALQDLSYNEVMALIGEDENAAIETYLGRSQTNGYKTARNKLRASLRAKAALKYNKTWRHI